MNSERKIPFLAGLSRRGLREWMSSEGQPGYRGEQVADWIFGRSVIRPEQMTNLPANLRLLLQARFHAPGSGVAVVSSSEDGTEKLLIELFDGESVEMVLIPSEERLTFCLSTQVGCPVQCRFCASGRDGLVRNLSAGEIIEEFLLGSERAGRRPDNLVFMGIGEGLLNYNELVKALVLLSSPDEFGMSPRRITVSTSGYVPGILKFAELEREFNLAISLHAPDDETRSKLIPPPFCDPVAEIMAAADRYREQAGRMVTLEYTLLKGVNDSLPTARKLAALARSHHAKVNLIPYNATDTEFQRPERRVIEAFARTVEEEGAHVTVRVERGAESTAACGQLRRQEG